MYAYGSYEELIKAQKPRLELLYENFTRPLYRVVLNKTGWWQAARSPWKAQERQYPMSIQEVSAEQLAQLFCRYQQALASDFGCRTEQADQSWEDIPQQEKKKMTAAARLALLELDSMEPETENARHYFARPGEAEWGC
jgi:hypothetical protein